MKGDEIAKKYGISQMMSFRKFLEIKNLQHKYTFMGELVVSDELVEAYVEQYREFQKELKLKEEAEEALQKAEAARLAREQEEEAREAVKKKKAMAEMLITSGFNFDGYRITKYSGYISGDDAISISRGTSGFFSSAKDVGEELTKSLVKIRRNAIKELKEAAYDLGCNAVIGVDFDYITLEPETANSSGGTTYLPYVFCVTANGNAVVIEKNEN